MNTDTLALQLWLSDCIRFGQFKLSSGGASNIYVNLRNIIRDPYLLRMVACWVRLATMNLEYDIVCGVPYGAIPLATAFSVEYNVPLIMLRQERKRHGMQNRIEGRYFAGQRCLLIEDVVTSGASVARAADALEQSGLHVEIVVVLDREQREHDYSHRKIHRVTTLSEVLDALVRYKKISEADASSATPHASL